MAGNAPRWLVTLLFMTALVSSAEPVRIAVYTSNPQQFPEALARFEQEHGKGLIELTLINPDTPPERIATARVIYAYLMNAALYERFAPAVRQAAQTGATVIAQPPDIAEHRWRLKPDAAASTAAFLYFDNGGVDNLAGFLAYCYKLGGGAQSLAVPAPVTHLTRGIYHPAAREPFASLDAYLAWYRATGRVPANAPLVGILFYQTNYKVHDLAHIDALIARLEKQGIGAVTVYGWPVPALAPLLGEPGKTPLRLLYSFNLGFAQSADVDMLARYGLHVIDLMTARDNYAAWVKAAAGISPERLSTQVALPEIAGATEPLVVATTEQRPDVSGPVTTPIAERIDMAVRRGVRWLALQDKPNAAKRLALLYFNNPPGKGNIGASYLNVFPTLVNVLNRLRAEGYNVGSSIPSEKELEALLELSGRNIELWAPGELRALVEKGHAILVPLKQYQQWFNALPREFRDFVNGGWSDPAKARLMCYTAPSGERYFVVPGIRLGNLFLGPQPLRSTFERASEMQHNTNVPPPHSYVAAYLWYRRAFAADAVVHFGRHGTLEFLPGKSVGQAGWDSSEVLLDDLPNAYYYILDGGGESTTARRRCAGVMVSHLTPLIVAAGTQERFAKLRAALESLDTTDTLSPGLQQEYRETALREIRSLKLDTQLRIDLAKLSWDEIRTQVDALLSAAEQGPIPAGMHTVGVLPSLTLQRDAVGEVLRHSLNDEERKRWRGAVNNWADAICNGAEPRMPAGVDTAARERLVAIFASATSWLHNLRESPGRELSSLIDVLNGRFEPSGPSGDPLRSPATLPSGRNLHTFDPNLIPTREAWVLGQKMARELLAKFQHDEGKFPEKVSMVLWYGETIRHQGAMEAEALYLMGVEPRWNGRGVVDGLRVIPESELGRKRVDVVLTLGGIYRDGFPDKVLLLDRASKLAAADGDNAIARHTRQIATALKQAGIDSQLAEKVASARAFASAPGDYGAGTTALIKQSKDSGKPGSVAEAYLHHMNHAYSTELWGESVPGALSKQLEGNQAVVHSRTSNVYGVLDNDDFYDYAGGLNAATKNANGGAAPAFYVMDMKSAGRERVTGIQNYIAAELNARAWNPKWIAEMQHAGYSGARAIANTLENLYGWQASSSEHIDGSFWQTSYDVYVADKNGMAMEQFFQKANPHAMQTLLARLIEVDRQGSYKFSATDRAEIIRRYVSGVAEHGATCSANTCGNRALNQYAAAQAALIPGLGNAVLRAFGRNIARATQWRSAAFAAAPAAVRLGVSEGLTPASHAAQHSSRRAARPYVSGYRMAQQTFHMPLSDSNSLPSSGLPLAVIFLSVGAGLAREAWRAAHKTIS